MSAAGELERVRRVLGAIEDPCMQAAGLGLSINDLGLVNQVEIDAEAVTVRMTFTEVGCPFVMRLLDDAERALQVAFPDRRVRVQPDWQPPWHPARLSGHAQAVLSESSSRLGRLFAGSSSDADSLGDKP